MSWLESEKVYSLCLVFLSLHLLSREFVLDSFFLFWDLSQSW